MGKKKRFLKKGKFGNKGQVTIFIIVAIVIVAAAVLIFLFYPKIQTIFGLGAKNPSAYMQSCIEDELKELIEKVSSQGGSLNPEHYILYQDNKIEYLCYTDEYYLTCLMQQPMLKQHVEDEIKKQIKSKADECFESMKNSFQAKGYEFSGTKGDVEIELLPKRIVARFNSTIILKKEGTDVVQNADVVLKNNLYELISIANSILNFEARYGDSETTTYMNYYPNLKVEKLKQTDGAKIYILTERNTKNKFQFASRSVVFPPGYGAEEVLR